MIDLRLAVQRAIYRAMDVPEVTDDAPVFQHVPDDQEPPVHIIGDLVRIEPIGTKGGGLDVFQFDILTLVRKPGREHLTPLMTAARSRLDGQKLLATGVDISRPVFEGDEDELLDDGQTYMGTQRFSLMAQPA